MIRRSQQSDNLSTEDFRQQLKRTVGTKLCKALRPR